MKTLQALRQNLWWRGPLHRFICWYLRRCGGAFHCYPYGEQGRYVALFTEKQYDSMEGDKALNSYLRSALVAPAALQGAK